jgi:hypothetical protein
MTFAFDTVDYERQLRKADIPYEQTHALADALRMSDGLFVPDVDDK